MKNAFLPLLTKTTLFTSLIIVLLGTSCINVNAQAPAKSVTYLLPDGRTLAQGNWDSLERTWGKGRIMLVHNKEDDASGIIHLVQQTDEITKQFEQQKAQHDHEFDTMLNKPAPLFELTGLDGKRWNLKELRGKIVVINFWFTTCPPCIREMPELNKLLLAYKTGDVVFLALTFNDAKQVKTFIKTHAFNYTLLPGAARVAEQYKIETWPTSIVIGKNGNIKKVILLSANIREELVAAIDSLK